MTDQYLQEQHALTIARTVQRERELAQARLDSDHGDSWVMITQTGEINPLPHEHIRHRSNARVGLELSVPKSLQQGRSPFTRKSDSGTVYITTQRVRATLPSQDMALADEPLSRSSTFLHGQPPSSSRFMRPSSTASTRLSARHSSLRGTGLPPSCRLLEAACLPTFRGSN